MVTKDKIRIACDRAIDNILFEGCTDVDLFSRPYELEFLKDSGFRTELRDTIVDSIITGDFGKLRLHKIGHVMIPKKNLFDFRRCALVDIYDEIVYLTLVLIMAHDIEKNRINKSKGVVFSYRFEIQDNGGVFDPKYNYSAFIDAAKRKTNIRTNNILVECDLSNFYGRLNIHRIDSTLQSISAIDTDIISLTNELLLFWANRDSYGLPVGSNGSRILAEAALSAIDKMLRNNNIDFCRFVDDYRFFAKSAEEAHNNLAYFIQCLSRDDITLNIQKTRIIDISEINHSSKGKNVSVTEELDDQDNVKQVACPISQGGFDNEKIGKIIRGYSGTVPTKFRELSQAQKKKYELNNLNELCVNLERDALIKPEQLTLFIKSIVAKEEYSFFSRVPIILKRFPQFIPYFTDVLIKKSKELDEECIQIIKSSLMEWFNDGTPEYIKVYIVHLLGSEPFADKNELLRLFKELKRNSGDYIGRALLEALDGKILREEALEIRDYFFRADNWERRQILKLVHDNIPNTEFRPFAKDIDVYTDDVLLSRIKQVYNKKNDG